MSHIKLPVSAGGSRLKALRVTYGKTQLDVELEASLGIGYLQRLELGKVQHPECDTLDRILTALGASYPERCEMLSLFGYAAPLRFPTTAETRWAVEAFQAEGQSAGVPVYLLDCTHRLLAWNTLVGNVFKAVNGTSTPALMPRLIFDPACGVADSVLNAEVFFPAQVRILRFEKRRWSDEDWFAGFIDEMRGYRGFDAYWRTGADLSQAPIRPVAPLTLQLETGVAQFRLISESFVDDPRFRLIYCIPADSATVQMLLAWQS